jgi:hypothetical protein
MAFGLRGVLVQAQIHTSRLCGNLGVADVGSSSVVARPRESTHPTSIRQYSCGHASKLFAELFQYNFNKLADSLTFKEISYF